MPSPVYEDHSSLVFLLASLADFLALSSSLVDFNAKLYAVS